MWFLPKPSCMTSSKSSYKGHLPSTQGYSFNYKQYLQGITDKLCLIYQRYEHLQMALSTHVKVMRLILQFLKQWAPVLWTHLSLSSERSKRCLETFPQSKVGIEWLPSSPSISDHILKMWKIFLSHLTAIRLVTKLDPSSLHPLAYQLDGYLSPLYLCWQ